MKALESIGPSAPLNHGNRPEVTGSETWLDLEVTPLILENFPRLRTRIRQELKTICDYVTGNMAGTGVLLTGSLSVGEGRCQEEPQPELLESDYDLVIVTPSFANTIPAIADKVMRRLFAKQGFSAPREITLIWKPLLALGMTTTAGRIMCGNDHLAGMLGNLPAPRAAGALEGAYCHLAAVPMAPPARHHTLLSKAFVRAARALLLDRYSNARRNLWCGLSSIKIIQDRIGDCGQFFHPDEMEHLRRAGDHLLRKEQARWGLEHYVVAQNLLDRIRRHIARPAGRRQRIKYATWVMQNGGPSLPLFSGNFDPLRALQLLVEAWGVQDAPRWRPMVEAAREVRKISGANFPIDERAPKMLYGRLFHILDRYAAFYPNKLYYPGCNGRGLK